jgi:uncharacterized protein (DUF433 family)
MSTAPPCEAVWIDPGRHGGDPCCGGTRVPVNLVVATVWRDGVDTAIDCWDLTRGQVLNACWYAAVINMVDIYKHRGTGYRSRGGPWRGRWGDWAEQVHGRLWSSDVADVPDPPRQGDA